VLIYPAVLRACDEPRGTCQRRRHLVRWTCYSSHSRHHWTTPRHNSYSLSPPTESGRNSTSVRNRSASALHTYLRLFCLLSYFWHAPLGVCSAIHRHQPPQRTVLGQVNCFIQCEVVGSHISLDGVQPRDTRMPWWSLLVVWWGSVRIILLSEMTKWLFSISVLTLQCIRLIE